ncbi:MAG: xanthine dehydrogenase family protein molybdopterin-binding subunit [Gammaproteobacteria bacterium]|nr:xanthine dehydrogenase family protein molybdopterin-binding subunit [Gammaproteobacteria bacterium]
MADIRKLSRRAFLGAVGMTGAAVGGLYLTGKLTAVQNKVHLLLHVPVEPVRLFVQIGADNRVTLVSHRVEMGQGIKTGLPLVLADELEADWSLVDVVQAPAHPDYGNQNTSSSNGILNSYSVMREIGATARKMLERAAASRWGVDEGECRAVRHQVLHELTGRSFSFGELAEAAAALPVPAVTELTFKSPADFRYIGKAVPSVDNADIVVGKAIYTADVVLPDMLFAVVENAPVLGAGLLRCDDAEARKVPGVVDIVILPQQGFPLETKPLHGVAVVARSTWSALQGRKKLKCEWSSSPYSTRGSEPFRQAMAEQIRTPGEVVRTTGDVDAAFASASQVHEATYVVPHLAHASMETPVAVADVGWNGCRLWVSTQNPQAVRGAVASLLDLPRQHVEVNVPLLGGGFGRKSFGDFASQAALISARVGRPVKLLWTREDDIRFDYYHAVSLQHYRAALDADGRVAGWVQRASYPSIQSTSNSSANKPSTGELMGGFANTLFEVPSLRSEIHPADPAVRLGWLRSVTSIQHAFANNCFADELAHARGKDPVENLLELIGTDRILDPAYMQLQHPREQEHPVDTARLKNVIRLVAQNSGYQQLGNGAGWGVAAHFGFFSYCAVATRVSVAGERLTLEEVHVALDCGQCVNTDRVQAQLEGAVIFGLSLALMGRIDVENGQVVQSNFHDYPILRVDQCPRIVTHLVPSTLPPSGVGETGVPPVAPSLVNAIFAASGKRLRELPLNRTYPEIVASR